MSQLIFTLSLALLILLLPGTADAQESTVTEKPGTRTLYLIRHGNYDEADKTDEALGRHLTPLGIAQARLLATRLRSLPIHFDNISTSPFTRARETAAVLTSDFGSAPARIVADLAECTPPTRNQAIMAKEKPVDLEQCKAQLERLAADLLQPSPSGDRHELVVCHGNITRWLVARALNVDVGSWATISLGHASLTMIRIQPDGITRLLTVGDVGHLPANLQTGRIDMPDYKLSLP